MGVILVTDDDKASRDVIQRTLERAGYAVESAEDVDHALGALSRTAFDLIVCDYRMPGKSGLDLLAQLNGEGSRIPVLMVSAFTDQATEAAAVKLGVAGMLRKPFRRDELIASVARALLH